MKSIRVSLTMVGLTLVFLVAGANGARAQTLQTTVFSGSINLPVEAQWQGKVLPAGNYSLYYGTRVDGIQLVEIQGKAKGSPDLFIMPQAHNRSSSSRNELVCARNGHRLVVMGLQMSGLGESLSFAMPHGMERMARNSGSGATSEVAAAGPQIQRVPVTTNRK